MAALVPSNHLARDARVDAGGSSVTGRATTMIAETLSTHAPSIPEDQRAALRDLIAEVLDREGVEGDEDLRIMEMTYWQG